MKQTVLTGLLNGLSQVLDLCSVNGNLLETNVICGHLGNLSAMEMSVL